MHARQTAGDIKQMGMWKMPNVLYVLKGRPLCDMSSVGFVLCRIPNFPRLLVITTGGKTFNLPLSPCKCVLRCVCLWFLYVLLKVEQRLPLYAQAHIRFTF